MLQSHDDPRHGTLNGYTHHKCRCSACGQAWRDYHNSPKSRARRAARKNIYAAQRRARREQRLSWEQRPEVRERSRAGRYGITVERLRELLNSGKCACCGSSDPGGPHWHIDHDHACCPTKNVCGQCVRGILCGGCNLALGHMKDDPVRLRAAAHYIEKYRQ